MQCPLTEPDLDRRRCLGLFLCVLVGLAISATLAERAAGPDALRPTVYDPDIRQAARQHLAPGWDWRILKAMVYQESRFDTQAVSRSGALGLGQVLPATARALGVNPDTLHEPDVGLDVGARWLRQCWDAAADLPDGPPRWERSRLAVAGYHAGATAVAQARHACGPAGRSWRAISSYLPASTRRHVAAVFDEALPRVRRLHPGGRSISRPRGDPHSTSVPTRLRGDQGGCVSALHAERATSR